MAPIQNDGTISPLPWREATFELAGRTVRCAVASGLGNARQLLHSLQRREVHYEFVEIMACPGGCVAGAGTMQSIKKSATVVGLYAKQAEHQTATGTHHVAELDKLVD